MATQAGAKTEPLLPPDEDEGFVANAKRGGKAACKTGCTYCAIGFFGLFILAFICQLILYFGFITLGCGPRAIGEGYHFPGGGKSNYGDAAYNLLPQDYLLSQRERSWWGWPLDVIPSNLAAAASGAQVGTWWRNAGPLWWTYTYEDISNSKLTAYMRVNFFVPWMSYKIARCDGKGPVVTFTETGFFIHNRIRRLFQMNQASQYSVYFDGELVADAKEVRHGYPSLTVNNHTTGDEASSSILSGRHFHGNMDQWYIHNKMSSQMPYYVTAAMSLPFAYAEMDAKSKKGAAAAAHDAAKPTQSPQFLLKPVGTGLAKIAAKYAELDKEPAAVEQAMPTAKVVATKEEERPAATPAAKVDQHLV